MCYTPNHTIVYVYLYLRHEEFLLAGLFLGLHPANERRRYKVTPPLMG